MLWLQTTHCLQSNNSDFFSTFGFSFHVDILNGSGSMSFFLAKLLIRDGKMNITCANTENYVQTSKYQIQIKIQNK